jgi:hypothetical protein
VQQPAGHDQSVSTQASVTGTSGPRPPSPAPPLPAQDHLSTPPNQSVSTVPAPSSSPPIPNRNNMRNRVELDSVSPGIERPNPLVSPITPTSPSGHNFSYPARAPPGGVPPRKSLSQEFNAQQSQKPFDHSQTPSVPPVLQQPFNQPQQPPVLQQPYNHSQQHQTPHQVGFGDRTHPAPLRPGHQPQTQQKQSTLANLKTAAAGIHVSLLRP